MKKVTVEQGSAEWLALRKKYIGGSDAPVIMNGEHFGKTPYKLWEEKLDLGVEKADNWGMKTGRDMEPIARERFMDMSGLFVVPQTLLHPDIQYMMASLDGMDVEGKNIVEIKYVGEEDHLFAGAGKVPEKYYPQLQHQIEVAQVDFAWYFSFDGKDGVMLKIGRNEDYIKKMLNSEEKFWNNVQKFIAPEMTAKDLLPMASNESWNIQLARYKRAKNELEALEKQMEDARCSLIEIASGKNCEGNGARLVQVVSKGAVDYKKIPELQSIDLEQYRKDPVKSWRLTIGK